jgi:hypothetical protein
VTPEQLEIFERQRKEREAEQRVQWDEEHKQRQYATRWSRCSASTRGWYWQVKPSWNDAERRGVDMWIDRPIASGFEPTLELAEARAKQIAGDHSLQEPAGYASNYLRRLAAEKRMNRKPNGNGQAARLELVWNAHYHVPDGPYEASWYYTPYRVVKKTANRVYVDRKEFDEEAWKKRLESGREMKWWDFDVETFILDRRKLESGEGAHSSTLGWYIGEFYPTREAAERASEGRNGTTLHFWWAEILGVKLPCDRKAIKAAYRKLAKQSHPDAGGDADAFVQVENAYRAGLEWAGGAA